MLETSLNALSKRRIPSLTDVHIKKKPFKSSVNVSLTPDFSVLTIQKRVPVAKSAYCSMVDSTLKIRHTRTMRKLDEDETFLSQTSPPPTVTVITHSMAHAHQPIVCNELKQTSPISLAVLSQDVELLCVFSPSVSLVLTADVRFPRLVATAKHSTQDAPSVTVYA